jgi:hypothetical protein
LALVVGGHTLFQPLGHGRFDKGGINADLATNAPEIFPRSPLSALGRGASLLLELSRPAQNPGYIFITVFGARVRAHLVP